MAGALYLGQSSMFKPGREGNFNAPQPPAPGNVLGPQQVQAQGPSQGFDPQYLQNLSTAIGGIFAPKKPTNVMKINPLGTLGEISPPEQIEGNAPPLGSPITWLQRALSGQGFTGT